MPGLTNFLRNRIVDWFHRGQSYTPPATVWVGLASTPPGPGGPGEPLFGTGYARQPIASGLAAWSGTQGDTITAISNGATGVTSNNIEVDFGLAGSAWGTAAHWELFDSAVGGNRLIYGTIVNGVGAPTPRVISPGDPVKFPVSTLRIQWL